jgi:hypothetical protein
MESGGFSFYFFFPQEKVTKRTLSPTTVSDEFSPHSLKFLISLCENRKKFLNAHSAEFVPEPSIKAEIFKIFYICEKVSAGFG